MMTGDTLTPGDGTGGAALVMALIVVMYAAMIAFGVYLYWRVAVKAGWPGYYCFLVFVPLANVVFMLMFVFKEWPIEAEVRALRAQVAASYRYGSPALPASYPGQLAPPQPWTAVPPGPPTPPPAGLPPYQP